MRNIATLAAVVLALLLASTAFAQPKKKRPKAPAKTTKTAGSGIHHPNTANAVAAAKSLGATKSAKALDTLLDALAMGLPPQVAAAALDALGEHAKSSSFDTLAFYLHHRSPNVRASAVKAMGKLSDKRAIAEVVERLGDSHKSVRAAAADVVARKGHRPAIKPLLELLKKGDEASAPALASMAKPELARSIGELIGTAPDQLVARCLGAILMRPDFKPEDARVEVVKSLGKIPGSDSLEQLTNYVGSIPEKPPRKSRKEAEAIIEARMGG